MTRLLLVLPLLAACGPGKSGDTDAVGTTGTLATTTDGPATTTPDDTGDVPTSPLSSDTTPSTTSDSGHDTGHDTGLATTAASITTHTTTGDTDATSTTATTDSTTGDPDVQYAAFSVAAGLDHLMIYKADFVNDRCTSLHIASPSQGDPNLKIVVPAEWGAQDGSILQGVAGCLDGMPMGPGVSAIAGAGAVDWVDPMAFCPPEVDLDLTLEFPQDMPWVPASEPMQVTALVVQNCQ